MSEYISEAKASTESTVITKSQTSDVAAIYDHQEINDSFKLSIWVPRDKVGLVIGKKGVNVLHIQAKSRAQVIISPQLEENSLWSPIVISGVPSRTLIAFNLIKETVEDVDDVVADFVVPRRLHQRIVGSGGITIRTISATTNTRIWVPGLKTLPPSSNITLEGECSNVFRALEQVIDVCFSESAKNISKRPPATNALPFVVKYTITRKEKVVFIPASLVGLLLARWGVGESSTPNVMRQIEKLINVKIVKVNAEDVDALIGNGSGSSSNSSAVMTAIPSGEGGGDGGDGDRDSDKGREDINDDISSTGEDSFGFEDAHEGAAGGGGEEGGVSITGSHSHSLHINAATTASVATITTAVAAPVSDGEVIADTVTVPEQSDAEGKGTDEVGTTATGTPEDEKKEEKFKSTVVTIPAPDAVAFCVSGGQDMVDINLAVNSLRRIVEGERIVKVLQRLQERLQSLGTTATSLTSQSHSYTQHQNNIHATQKSLQKTFRPNRKLLDVTRKVSAPMKGGGKKPARPISRAGVLKANSENPDENLTWGN